MIYILILNWNGWRDTLGCLESVMNLKDVPFRIIVCDNNSSDDSERHITNWLAGNCAADTASHPRLKSLTGTEVRPSFAAITRTELDASLARGEPVASDVRLLLIQNEGNLGFAAGNNSGLRYALAQPDMTHVWLLNNDTLVDPSCLENMLQRMQAQGAPSVCGSRVMFYDDPSVVQALGGNRFNFWTGMASQSIGRFQPESESRHPAQVESSLDYISGCSMLIPREFLETVGLMNERYFLYYEEIDWAVRAGDRFALIYADDALVYHKEGSSIGTASLTTRPSALSDFYLVRNRLRFMRRYFPARILICYAASLAQVVNRVRRGYWSSARLLLGVLLGLKRQV